MRRECSKLILGFWDAQAGRQHGIVHKGRPIKLKIGRKSKVLIEDPVIKTFESPAGHCP